MSTVADIMATWDRVVKPAVPDIFSSRFLFDKMTEETPWWRAKPDLNAKDLVVPLTFKGHPLVFDPECSKNRIVLQFGPLMQSSKPSNASNDSKQPSQESSSPRVSAPSSSRRSIGSKEKKMRRLRPGEIVTSTGVLFDPLNPRVEDVKLEDIAHALSNICRFTGHVRRFYCVAEHSVHVSKLAEFLAKKSGASTDEVSQAGELGLLHDASEAYLCDVARPLKAMKAFKPYLAAERRLSETIYQAVGVVASSPWVAEADRRIVTNEAYALMPVIPRGWKLEEGFTNQELEAAGIDPQFLDNPRNPADAKRHFGERAYRLGLVR